MTHQKSRIQTFYWEGINGRRESVKGALDAEDIHRVRAKLREQGITPRKIRKKSNFSLGWGQGVRPRDITLFSRQLATMIKAGVPMVQALSISIEGQNKKKMRDLLIDLRDQIAAGTSVAQAMRRHPQVFDELFCSLVEAGETSGALEEMLERVAQYKERMESIKNRIKKALYYPVFVFIIGLVVSALLLVKVVPEFESMFAGFGADLPGFTQSVVNLSRFMQAWWHLVFAALLIGLYGMLLLRAGSQTFAYGLSRMALKLPLIGTLLHKSAVARFSRTLATCFAAGVPLADSMNAAAKATGSLVYTRSVLRMKEDVAAGQQLHFAMRQAKHFPVMVSQMVAVGEEAGALDAMLLKVADFFEEEVNTLVDAMSSLLEPLVIVVLGVLVGGLVIALYLPIFQMGDLL